MLGQELDSLADSVCIRSPFFLFALGSLMLSRLNKISFGVAPAVLAFSIGMRTQFDTLILASFICCGVARLARFNATVAAIPKDAGGKSKYFEGLPIPTTLGPVCMMAEFVRRGWIEGPGGLGSGLPGGLVAPLKERFGLDVHWLSLLFAVWGAAMVSKVGPCGTKRGPEAVAYL
jgi:CDP-diacylglycerol--serine O-phosphatidyltransferase